MEFIKPGQAAKRDSLDAWPGKKIGCFFLADFLSFHLEQPPSRRPDPRRDPKSLGTPALGSQAKCWRLRLAKGPQHDHPFYSLPPFEPLTGEHPAEGRSVTCAGVAVTPERGKTWLRWYRKTEMSDIWTRHPLYLKVWAWLLANVDLDTGEITCTYEHIADRVQWEDKGHPHTPSRKVIHDILHWMKLNSMLSITTLGEGNRKYTKVSVSLWLTYQSKKSADRNRTETEKLPSFKNKEEATTELKTTTFVASHDAIRCLRAWEQYRPIIEKHRQAYLQVFDDLHRLDKLPWDGEDGIFAICAFAVKEWTAKMIQAPSKLRKPSQKYPELKTWEVIQGQIKDQHNHRERENGKPSALQVADEIMEKSARMEKEQGELLARRKREAGL